jgi:hypothetical protein
MHAGDAIKRVAGSGQTSDPWRLSRSVIDSDGLAGAEFSPIDSVHFVGRPTIIACDADRWF